ncbi:MAG TPA: tRNA (adenosine(37)-N6)-threonylcarbamoyltransferase complex dimerization subunit type 1 TsaB [Solirubrobacteraceae bacterium]|nr:tRNA (adenosine(37)-N6)-threonylcarbamoyltransferase complex dimerization subunit type 1 TsaB [Solirubrobacteraceae bacterium]
MTTLLAFDTATPATAVALLGEGAERELRHDPAPGERPGHAAQLLPLAHRLLAEAGLTFADLDRIAVGTGPGTFTGLRIGVATARALAQAASAELTGVSTLQALAAAAAAQAPDGRVLAVLDARRGEAFTALYEHGAELSPPAAVTPGILATMARADALAVGDGAVRFRDVLAPSGIGVPADGDPLHRVSALALARLAASAPASVDAAVTPDYVRVPDAELTRRRKEEAAAS